MGVMYYILSPFSWLLNFFYSFTDSYGISLILFALVIKIILFPLTIKGKKGMIQMNLLSGKMQQLQKQYGKDGSATIWRSSASMSGRRSTP